LKEEASATAIEVGTNRNRLNSKVNKIANDVDSIIQQFSKDVEAL
jgi:hypothetical protein